MLKKSIAQILAEACASDESTTDNVDLATNISDTEFLMDNIPDVELEDAKLLRNPVTVENVRILVANENYYIEFSELHALVEDSGMSVTSALDAILDRYEGESTISKNNFSITIPKSLFEETIGYAEEGDPKALHQLRDGCMFLRNMINLGLPIKKID